MTEFTLELYRSRSAEIAAARADALAAYETAALASALDPSAGGQLEARAALADIDAQQEALDAAYTKFSRDGLRAEAIAKWAAWEKDRDQVETIAATALASARERLEAIAAEVDEIANRYIDARSKIRKVCSGHKISTKDLRPGDVVGGRFKAVTDINGPGSTELQQALRAGSRVRDLLGHFDNLAGEGVSALKVCAPDEPVDDVNFEEAA